MSNFRPHIITLLVSASHSGREAVESAFGCTFDSREDVIEHLAIKDSGIKAVGIWRLNEFCTACNDSDDDSRKQEWSDIIENLDDYWVGHINMRV